MRCAACGAENHGPAVWCWSCRARLGQERERAVVCDECRRAEVWNPRTRLCEDCDEHADVIGERLADFDDWQRSHRDTVQAVELG